jgi:hypothetical protein
LALVALLAYAFNRGVFIGSDIVLVHFEGDKVAPNGRWVAKCHYLFPSGVTVQIRGTWNTREEAQDEFCRLFRD